MTMQKCISGGVHIQRSSTQRVEAGNRTKLFDKQRSGHHITKLHLKHCLQWFLFNSTHLSAGNCLSQHET